jgi:microcystin-dependent protein
MAQDLPSVPVGTIVSFAGTLDEVWLKSQGWLYCNGQSLKKTDFIELFLNIGTNYGATRQNYNLPDFRGYFQRAVDDGSNNDPYVGTRGSTAGGASGDNPGSIQADYTKAPTTAFSTSVNGKHSHNVPHAPVDNNAYAVAGGHYGLWTSNSPQTQAAGNHTHVLAGGDKEMRPVNKYVYFIIKYASTAPANI